ncbi:MAG: hypothetical protein ACJAWH_001524 [Maribacter sp.]|jgi:hypothetical protein
MILSILLVPVALVVIYKTLLVKTKKVLQPIKVRSTSKKF